MIASRLARSLLLLPLALLAAPPLVSQEAGLSLGPKESAWIREHATIHLAVDDNNPPMNYRASDGTMHGLHIDYIRLMAQKLGITVRFEGSDWDTALRRALAHEVDGIVNANITAERRRSLDFTKSYFSTPDAILSGVDAPPFTGPDAFSGKVVGVIKGSVRADAFRTYSPGSTVKEVSNLQEGIKDLSDGTLDAFFDELPVVQNLLETYYLSNLRLNALIFFPGLGTTHIGFRNDEPMLTELFNRAIDDISPEENRAIRSRYLATNKNVAVLNNLSLTDDEKAFIKAHPVIRVATDPDYAPIEFTDKTGAFRGLAVDYLETVAEKTGIRFEFARGKSWAQLVDLAKRGEVDLFSALTTTPERSAYLEFTKPFLSIPVMVFAPKPIAYVSQLSDLDGETVVMVEGYGEAEMLRSRYPTLNVSLVANTRAGLRMVAQKRAAAFVGNMITTLHYLREERMTDVQIVGNTDVNLDLSFAVRNDWPQLAHILDKTLDSLPQSVTDAIYRKWVPSRIERVVDLRTITLTIGISLFLVALFFVWNRSLRRVINKRDEALAELEATQEKLVHSAKLASIGTLVSGIAHELNNPLNYVTTGLEALDRQLDRLKAAYETEDGDEIERRREAVNEIYRNIATGAFRASEIVTNLREYVRPATEKRERVDVNDVVRKALKLLSNEYRDSVEVRFSAGDVEPVSAFPGKLDHVFVNLIKNAIESVKSAGRQGTGMVAVTTGRHDSAGVRFVRIVVEDNGGGIAPKALSRIFDPFYTTKAEGTGLGLSISNTIVENHGGHIEVSASGEGTAFAVLLPVDGTPQADNGASE